MSSNIERGGNLCSSCYRVAWPVALSCAVPATKEKLIGSDVTREKGKVTHDKRGQFSEGRLVICGQLLSALKGLQSTFSASGIQKNWKNYNLAHQGTQKMFVTGEAITWRGLGESAVCRNRTNQFGYCQCAQAQYDPIWHNRTWCKTMLYSIIQ